MCSFKEYEAISYVWGSTQDVGFITCQGLEVEVRANLVQALLQVRYINEPRTLWVDALCINQHDVPEKSVQVNMMGEIYSHASRVIVCFGDDGRNGETAQVTFETIRDFNRLAAKHRTESLIAENKFWRLDDALLEGPRGSATRERLLHAVKIFEKPWFQRVWALQEVGLSRVALLAYGDSTINFTEIMEFVESWIWMVKRFKGVDFCSGWVSNLFQYVWATYPVRIDQSWFRSSYILTTAAQRAMRTYKPAFEDVLFRARLRQKATDPRDFVYAFLGHPLARSDDGELLISADYTRTMSELRLAFFSRLCDRSLRSLGLIWHNDPIDLSEGPSWCPHLDTSRHWTMNGRYDASRGESVLNEAGSTRPQVRGTSLEAPIYIVDTVLHCGEVAGGEDIATGGKDARHVAIRSTATMLGKQPSLAEEYWAILEATETGDAVAFQDRALAFAQTLLNACDEDHPASVAKSFGDFCKGYCPLIYSHLEEHDWFGRWASAEPKFIPFVPRCASSIDGQRFFTTKKGYWYAPLIAAGPSNTTSILLLKCILMYFAAAREAHWQSLATSSALFLPSRRP